MFSTRRGPKYRNRNTVVDGETFDSQAEAQRWRELRLMQDHKQIQNLQRQVKFVLSKARKGERSCSYVADFVYDRIVEARCYDKPEYTERVVEDVKGFRTPEYVVKRKWMFEKYGIEIREVGKQRKAKKRVNPQPERTLQEKQA
ncbi:MAG TPA: DUF1064 domain-containing protein [Tepidisphaeraceae bacterium]|nr:DUF1064 domain-containing protein [Tepidisphaeraceae bacterium]